MVFVAQFFTGTGGVNIKSFFQRINRVDFNLKNM